MNAVELDISERDLDRSAYRDRRAAPGWNWCRIPFVHPGAEVDVELALVLNAGRTEVVEGCIKGDSLVLMISGLSGAHGRHCEGAKDEFLDHRIERRAGDRTAAARQQNEEQDGTDTELHQRYFKQQL